MQEGEGKNEGVGFCCEGGGTRLGCNDGERGVRVWGLYDSGGAAGGGGYLGGEGAIRVDESNLGLSGK